MLVNDISINPCERGINAVNVSRILLWSELLSLDSLCWISIPKFVYLDSICCALDYINLLNFFPLNPSVLKWNICKRVHGGDVETLIKIVNYTLCSVSFSSRHCRVLPSQYIRDTKYMNVYNIWTLKRVMETCWCFRF